MARLKLEVTVRIFVQAFTKTRPGALELCCGHAGLTAALWDHGFDATGSDWVNNKHQPTVPILQIDLTTPEGQASIHDLLKRKAVRYVHMPPCVAPSPARGNARFRAT